MSDQIICLKCFDAVGWAAGRAYGLLKQSGDMLAWLSAGARCRLAYGPADATATHCLLLQIGFTFLVLAYLGSPGKRAVKRGGVCVCDVRSLCSLVIVLRNKVSPQRWRDDMPPPIAVSVVAKIAADLRLYMDGSAVYTSLVASNG